MQSFGLNNHIHSIYCQGGVSISTSIQFSVAAKHPLVGGFSDQAHSHQHRERQSMLTSVPGLHHKIELHNLKFSAYLKNTKLDIVLRRFWLRCHVHRILNRFHNHCRVFSQNCWIPGIQDRIREQYISSPFPCIHKGTEVRCSARHEVRDHIKVSHVSLSRNTLVSPAHARGLPFCTVALKGEGKKQQHFCITSDAWPFIQSETRGTTFIQIYTLVHSHF